MSKPTDIQRLIEEEIGNCDTFDEFITDCMRDIRDDFIESTGEDPNSKEDLIEFARELWDEHTSRYCDCGAEMDEYSAEHVGVCKDCR